MEGLRLEAFRAKSGTDSLRSQQENLLATDRRILEEAQQMRLVMEQREIESVPPPAQPPPPHTAASRYRRRWQEPRQVIQQVKEEVRPSLGNVRENLTSEEGGGRKQREEGGGRGRREEAEGGGRKKGRRGLGEERIVATCLQ
eukprot:753457-Hanusia_phi.AAC.3